MTITLIHAAVIILEFVKGRLIAHYMAIRIYSQTEHQIILKGLGKEMCY